MKTPTAFRRVFGDDADKAWAKLFRHPEAAGILVEFLENRLEATRGGIGLDKDNWAIRSAHRDGRVDELSRLISIFSEGKGHAE